MPLTFEEIMKLKKDYEDNGFKVEYFGGCDIDHLPYYKVLLFNDFRELNDKNALNWLKLTIETRNNRKSHRLNIDI